MTCRMLAIVLAAGMAALWASAALGASRTTVSTTIQDTDGDQLLEPAPGEDYAVVRPTDPFPDNPDLRPPLGGEFDARPHSSILHFLQLTILTGDNADSQQFNETRWFIDILDGQKKVDPNSGIEGTCDPDPESLY